MRGEGEGSSVGKTSVACEAKQSFRMQELSPNKRAFEHCGAFRIFIMAAIDEAGKQFSARNAKVRFLAAHN